MTGVTAGHGRRQATGVTPRGLVLRLFVQSDEEVDPVMQHERVETRVVGAALVAGVLGVVSAFVMYWMVLPGVVLGLAAVVLGAVSRRHGARDAASVAMTLGVVAVLAVPAFLATADSAEDWGRDCALDPSHDPNC